MASLATPLLAAAPPSPRKGVATPDAATAAHARTLLHELARVHPLLRLGVGLLSFAAETALVTAGATLAALYRQKRPALAADKDALFFRATSAQLSGEDLAIRLACFALNVLTVAVAAALLDGHHRRCFAPPPLRAAVLVGAAAGAAALAWATLLARGWCAHEALPALEMGATLCTAAYSLLLFIWNLVRGYALREWVEATEAMEDARDAAEEAAAEAEAALAKVAQSPRCCDEESVPASPHVPAEPAVVPMPAVDAAMVLAAAAAECDALAPLAAAPCGGAALRELCVAHPLLRLGTGLLVYAAQAFALSAGVAVGVAASGAADDSRQRARLAGLALDALTLGAAACVLYGERAACVAPPPLSRAVLVASAAGGATIGYALAFTSSMAGVPSAEGTDLAATICTASAAMCLFVWNAVRFWALGDTYGGDDVACEEDEDAESLLSFSDDDVAAQKKAAAQ